MNCSLVRGVIGTAVACGAFLTGPMVVGVAVSGADALGLGGGGGGIDVLGVDVLGGGKKTAGSATTARVNSVSTAPSARSVVIRSNAPVAQSLPAVQPAVSLTPVREVPASTLGSPVARSVPSAPPPAATPPAPAALPGVATPPAAPVVVAPAPQAAPITPTTQPRPSARPGGADGLTPKAKIPNTFRVGYAEYLRTATTADIMMAALPGAAGIAGFTIVGAYAGYRQAKALQEALLAPVPTSVLL
jgi:hypothetical protein